VNFELYVIRPYPTKIRTIIFSALQSVGAQFKEEWIAQPESPDIQILRQLSNIKPQALLCPFNPHKDKNGLEVHGISILEKMHDEHLINLPVFMPVTSLGKARCINLFKQAIIPNKERILFIDQTRYEGEGLLEYMVQHLKKYNL